MSRTNSLNIKNDYVVASTRIDLHTFVRGTENATTGTVEASEFKKANQSFMLLGLVLGVAKDAGSGGDGYAGAGDTVEVGCIGVDGAKIKVLTGYDKFNFDGAYFFIVERSSTDDGGADNVYEPGITGALIQSRESILDTNKYVGRRVLADFDYVRTNDDGTATYRFDIPKLVV